MFLSGQTVIKKKREAMTYKVFFFSVEGKIPHGTVTVPTNSAADIVRGLLDRYLLCGTSRVTFEYTADAIYVISCATGRAVYELVSI